VYRTERPRASTRFSVATDAAGAAVAVFRGSVGVRSLLLDVSREMMVREGFVASGNDTLALERLDLPDPWDGFSGDVLPDVPQASDEKPSSASLEETRRTANSAARSEAVVRAAERHERVRERVDSRERGPDGGRKGLLDEASRATADATASAADGVDAVADAPAALAEELERNAVELWLNAASGGSLFDVTLLSNTGNSVDQVLIAVTGGGSWTLDESLVQSVLDGGQSLPQDLISELDAQGITDTDALAQQLLGLFR
jgi:hypothetical protein